ncbi:MAG TPA: hypothetical protein PKH10_05830 [bacterium]|nr:hypothetical protein [bacterium]
MRGVMFLFAFLSFLLVSCDNQVAQRPEAHSDQDTVGPDDIGDFPLLADEWQNDVPPTESEAPLADQDPFMPPDDTTDNASDDTADTVPDDIPDAVPDVATDETTDHGPDETTDEVPDEVPDEMNDETSDSMPEEDPDLDEAVIDDAPVEDDPLSDDATVLPDLDLVPFDEDMAPDLDILPEFDTPPETDWSFPDIDLPLPEYDMLPEFDILPEYDLLPEPDDVLPESDLLPEADIVTPDPDQPLPDPDTVTPDIDIVPDACTVDGDCAFGYRCDTTTSPRACLFASTCANDFDCQTYQTCQVVGNWKECRLDLSDSCETDADCAPGEVCETVILGYKVCRSMNKCLTSEECAANEVCDWTGSYYDCVAVCTVDTDCAFGYQCIAGTPYNRCEYANECQSDADCPAFRTCEPSGNWMQCILSLGGGLCLNDTNCDPSEYCDLSLGFFGTCKSRDQCLIDADCGDNMKCEFNGTYYECVPTNPKQCLFDFQCPTDWICAQNVCTPQYAGTCTEIEGLWNVLVSTALFFTTGSSYEFIPKDGCDGSIKQEGGTVSSGTFAQTSAFNYDITMLLFFNCQASITLNAIMQVTCSSGSATLIRSN